MQREVQIHLLKLFAQYLSDGGDRLVSQQVQSLVRSIMYSLQRVFDAFFQNLYKWNSSLPPDMSTIAHYQSARYYVDKALGNVRAFDYDFDIFDHRL